MHIATWYWSFKMTKRYYISPIIGDGSEFNPYRPKIADHNVPWVGNIPSDPVNGAPLFAWSLVLVNPPTHAALLTDSTLDALPEFPLDGKVSSIQTATKNAMIAKLKARSIDTGFIAGTDGYREVIRGIGKTLEPAFDENNFDIN